MLQPDGLVPSSVCQHCGQGRLHGTEEAGGRISLSEARGGCDGGGGGCGCGGGGGGGGGGCCCCGMDGPIALSRPAGQKVWDLLETVPVALGLSAHAAGFLP